MKYQFSARPNFLGYGAGLRPDHYADILAGKVKEIEWFEAISENFLGFGESPRGRPLETLLKVRADFPIVLHGVSLSIGGTDSLDYAYLNSLKSLYRVVEPAWVSDHLCWTGVHGKNLHDLLPLPYTRSTARHVADRIAKVQEFLGRKMTIENVSSYLSYRDSEMTEWEFLSEIHRLSGCEFLLDVNNVYVSAINHSFSAQEFIDGVPLGSVRQMHLAGHSSGESLLIDTHDAPVCEAVWDLYAHARRRFGDISTMIEWDANIPPLEILEEEVARAKRIGQSIVTAQPARYSDRTL